MKIQKRPRFGKALIIVALVAVTAATWVYARRETLFDKPTDPSLLTPIVRTETLKADRTLSSRIVQNMQVDAVERVELLPRVTGRLLALHVKQGDRVKKGQVVATLEHEQQDAHHTRADRRNRTQRLLADRGRDDLPLVADTRHRRPAHAQGTLRVPELKIFSVAVGMPVTLRFDALPGESFGGSVTRIDQYVDPATRTSSVEIVLDNEKQAGGRLRPGMFGQAAIVEKSFAGTLTVPEGALHASETGLYVYVVADGKAAQREVATGIQDGGRVQILGGLAEGDEVIIFGGNNLRDGEAVTVRN